MASLRFSGCVVSGSLTLLLLHSLAAAADNAAVSVLEKADAATHSQSAYRMTMTVTDSRGAHLTTLEYVRPDHYHIVLEARKMEMILIGKTTYMKSKGPWRKLPGDMRESIAQLRPGLTRDALQNASVTRSGSEVVNGVATTIYEVTQNSPSLHSVKKYWISNKGNFLYQMAGTSDFSSTQVMGRKAGGRSFYTAVIDYKANVKIEAPQE